MFPSKNNVALFVGHYAPAFAAIDGAVSIAGNQVQRQIFREVEDAACLNAVSGISMIPVAAWPRGRMLVPSCTQDSVFFPGYLNFPVLKHLFFSLYLLKALFLIRPSVCIQYNSYFFENLALLIYKLASTDVVLSLIIQDVHAGVAGANGFRARLRSISERWSLLLARRFDFIVPISQAIADDFGFSKDRNFVFQGGLTAFAEELMRNKHGIVAGLDDIGVFAGALEPHNGVDKLVAQWLASDIQFPLHVFGRGSLSGFVQDAATRSTRVIYHGLQAEDVVLSWQARARWNFCLRYSIGIDERYFFPSKFFNVMSSPGAVVVNDFYGLPPDLKPHLAILSDDLKNLSSCMDRGYALSAANEIEARRFVLRDKYSWRRCVDRLLNALNVR